MGTLQQFLLFMSPTNKTRVHSAFQVILKAKKVTSFFYLAVSGCDHVDVVTDQFEGEASIHQGEAALWRKRTE